eukprot:3623290-Amphidinium_carterae.1
MNLTFTRTQRYTYVHSKLNSSVCFGAMGLKVCSDLQLDVTEKDMNAIIVCPDSPLRCNSIVKVNTARCKAHTARR